MRSNIQHIRVLPCSSQWLIQDSRSSTVWAGLPRILRGGSWRCMVPCGWLLPITSEWTARYRQWRVRSRSCTSWKPNSSGCSRRRRGCRSAHHRGPAISVHRGSRSYRRSSEWFRGYLHAKDWVGVGGIGCHDDEISSLDRNQWVHFKNILNWDLKLKYQGSTLVEGASLWNTGMVAQLILEHHHPFPRLAVMHLDVFVKLEIAPDVRSCEVIYIQTAVALVLNAVIYSTAVSICVCNHIVRIVLVLFTHIHNLHCRVIR